MMTTVEAGAGKPKRRRIGIVVAPLIVFAGMVAMFGYALKTGDPSKLPSALIGKPAPVVDLPPLAGLMSNGQPVAGFKTGDLGNGTVTVVNFFASWCQPCVDEHPVLIDLQTRMGVPIYGIDYKDPPPGGLKFIERLGNPYVAVGVDASGRAGIDWGVYGMPESFVIDGKGAVVYKHVGPISPQTLTETVIPAIEAARRAR